MAQTSSNAPSTLARGPSNLSRQPPPPSTTGLSEGPTSLTDMGSRPAQTLAAPRALDLIPFRPRDRPKLCPHFNHWGLLLSIGDGAGDLYHNVSTDRRQVDSPPEGQPGCMGCISRCGRPNICRGCFTSSGPGMGYEIKRNYNPNTSANQVVHRRAHVSDSINAEDLLRICNLVHTKFPYNAEGESCQKFSIRVLRQMVHEGTLTIGRSDAIKGPMHTPKTTSWSAIRNDMPNLRN
jgi:hypothetical protein